MSYSIIKYVRNYNPISYNLRDDLEIIQTHSNYKKALENFDKIVSKYIDTMRSNGFSICPEPYMFSNDIVVYIAYTYGIVKFILTDDYMKYI